ncbi:MAG: YjjG family noncanonical pyrimidine nucleotidase [Bacteroidota bacterium]
MKYRHIFFDLDHTLWDFDKNCHETLTELYHHFQLDRHGISSIEHFIKTYLNRNEMMWEQYRFGKIDKETLRNKRFDYTFYDLEIDNEILARNLSDEYVLRSPYKTNLFPGTHEALSYLKEKYILHIITNGFKETQFIKMNSTNLTDYFSEIILSEDTGFKKPDPRIFFHSLEKADAKVEESLMVGDNLEADIAGARSAGMDQVYFNPKRVPHQQETTYEIHSLMELLEFL